MRITCLMFLNYCVVLMPCHRDVLSSLVDDFQNEFHLLLLENNKNIPLISSLPGARGGPCNTRYNLMCPFIQFLCAYVHHSPAASSEPGPAASPGPPVDGPAAGLARADSALQ